MKNVSIKKKPEARAIFLYFSLIPRLLSFQHSTLHTNDTEADLKGKNSHYPWKSLPLELELVQLA